MSKKMINVNFNTETLETIDKDALKKGLSRGALIRMIVMVYCDKLKKEVK